MKTDLIEMQELTNEELMLIEGGGFWGDVGYAIGYAAGAVKDAFEYTCEVLGRQSMQGTAIR